MTEQKPTTGIREIDRILGGVVQSDNIVWEWDSGAPIDRFMAGFLAACERERSPVVYVSFNRSSQTVAANHRGMISKGLFTLVDCFSYGKGNADRMFLHSLPEFPEGGGALGLVHVERPSDPVELQNVLISIGARSGGAAKYVFDSLTGMLDVWGDEERVIRFFGYFCPRLHDLNTIACWLLEKGAHSPSFLAKVRHITQVVLEIGVSQGVGTLTVRKAADRVCGDIGIPHPFRVEDGRLDIRVESREGRELALLTSMSEALDRGLDPAAFFEKTMDALASEIGMVRGTLALLDKTTGRLRTVAALGHAAAGAELGGVAEEEIVGQVLHTGIPEVVPDISRDPRFRHRGLDGEDEPSPPTAFLGVPLRVDGQAVGVLCVERSFAAEAALEKDLRLLSIVAATVSQAIKINRMIRMEKEEIAVRHREHVRDLRRQYRIDHVVGESEAIKQVLATAGLAAKSQASILITGETGTGKELVAHVVHYNSSRAKGPFVKVNCGALSETLLESELFGHLRGSFTGALRDHKGRFELADGGTIFLDEIGDMSSRLQVKLLRVIQERAFEPVGGTETISVNVRIVAATSRNLKEEIAQGRFRQDLYYRLNVVPIHLPPLRERRSDISMLMNHFLDKFNRQNHKKVTRLSREVLDMLLDYPWPGNIRELENCIERAVVLSHGDTLAADLLPAEVRERRSAAAAASSDGRTAANALAEIGVLAAAVCETSDNLAESRRALLESVESAALRTALKRETSQRELAIQFGMSRMTLRGRLKRYGLDRPGIHGLNV